MNIHKEGYHTIFLTTAVLFTCNAAVSYFVPSSPVIQFSTLGLSLVLLFFTLYFFRKPTIPTQNSSQQVMAPCSGKVVAIEEVLESEYFHDTRKQISILTPFSAPHVTHVPLSGSISYYKHHPGNRLFALYPKSSTDNEHSTIVIQGKSGSIIQIKQTAGGISNSIKNQIVKRQKVVQGQNLGFIKTISFRIDLFLPLDAEINVKIGDSVKVGKSIVATL